MPDSMKPERINGIDDYLGLAAKAKHKGVDAVKAGNYEDAWYYFHQQQSAYANHVNSPIGEFTPEQASVLLSAVNEQLANVLRLEGKHRQAFVHIVYWCAWGAATGRLTKSMESKLKSYFKRCAYSTVDFDFVETLIKTEVKSTPDFARIQSCISEWD